MSDPTSQNKIPQDEIPSDNEIPLMSYDSPSPSPPPSPLAPSLYKWLYSDKDSRGACRTTYVIFAFSLDEARKKIVKNLSRTWKYDYDAYGYYSDSSCPRDHDVIDFINTTEPEIIHDCNFYAYQVYSDY